MDASGAARAMVDACGLTHRQVAARLGRYDAWLSQTLARPRLGADVLAQVAHACGYRLELVPTMGGDEIVIGDEAPAMDAGTITSGAGRVEEARALMARAIALLDSTGLGTD